MALLSLGNLVRTAAMAASSRAARSYHGCLDTRALSAPRHSRQAPPFIPFCFRQFICWTAYTIRLFAIKTYGLVIHEFDPWFNFRATQYLSDHGVTAFFQWFDYMSWYPLGRPVGTTIYPGMQPVPLLCRSLPIRLHCAV